MKIRKSTSDTHSVNLGLVGSLLGRLEGRMPGGQTGRGADERMSARRGEGRGTVVNAKSAHGSGTRFSRRRKREIEKNEGGGG